MKILMVTDRMKCGGAESHILTLADALTQRGHTVHLTFDGGEMAQRVQHPVHPLPFMQRTPAGAAACIRGLARLQRQEGYDVIHAHARLPALYCRLARLTPLTVTAHFPFSLRFPAKQLSVWGERTLAVSRDIGDYLHREYGIPWEHICLTVNGIDGNVFAPAGPEAGPEELLHVSRLDTGRALAAEVLLEIFPALLKTFPKLCLTVVGDGDRRPALAAEAARLNRTVGREAVRLAGASLSPQTYLQGRAAFVGVSRAALEAMACACPTVLAGDEGTLGLFDPQDPALCRRAEASNFCCRDGRVTAAGTLLPALRTLLSLPRAERQRLGEAGRAYVLERYSPERMARDAEAVYRSVRRQIFCGYYGYGNTGDELSLLALQKSEGTGDALSARNALRLLPRLRPGVTFVLGGGTLLQDSTSRRSLVFYTGMFRLAKRRGCRCLLRSCGVGPLTHPSSRRQAAQVLRLAEDARFRTAADLEAAQELYPAGRYILSHDAVLDLPLSAKMGQGYAVFCPRRADETARAVCRAIRQVCSRVLLLPMHPAQDGTAVRALAAEGFGEAVCPTPEEVPSLLAGADFAAGERLHAALLCLAAGVPFAALPQGRCAGEDKLLALHRDLEELWGSDNPALCFLPTGQDAWPALLAETKKHSHRKEILLLAEMLRNRE